MVTGDGNSGPHYLQQWTSMDQVLSALYALSHHMDHKQKMIYCSVTVT